MSGFDFDTPIDRRQTPALKTHRMVLGDDGEDLFPAGVAAISMLAIPVIGVFSSALVLGEPTGPRELISLTLVCLALGVVVVWPALRDRAGPS